MKKVLLEKIVDTNTLDWEVVECTDGHSLFENGTEGIKIKLINDEDMSFTYALVDVDSDVEVFVTEADIEIMSELVDFITEVLDNIEDELDEDE